LIRVKNVSYVNGDFKKGAQITIENLGQMPMPTTVQVKFKRWNSKNGEDSC
jgi:hypothetical protein